MKSHQGLAAGVDSAQDSRHSLHQTLQGFKPPLAMLMTDSDPITKSEFAALCAQLPRVEPDAWHGLPWQVSLSQAYRIAAREGKPLAIVVRSGHPLGCTCNNGLVDRGWITSDASLAALLATKFVPVAIDQHIHRRLDGREGRLFRDLVERAGQSLDVSAQGFYAVTASGELLAFRHAQHPTIVKEMLTEALSRAEAGSGCFVDQAEEEEFTLAPPAGVMVIDVISKVLSGYPEASTGREQILHQSHGRDHCWIREDEVADLSAGVVPESLLIRMVRFHLVDNTRGEPPMWRADQIRSAKAALQNGCLIGSVRLESAGSRRGYSAALFGLVDARKGALNHFDVVARGIAWGRGYYNSRAPSGQYPFAVRFALAQGAWPFDGVPPGAARTRAGEYLGEPRMAGAVS